MRRIHPISRFWSREEGRRGRIWKKEATDFSTGSKVGAPNQRMLEFDAVNQASARWNLSWRQLNFIFSNVGYRKLKNLSFNIKIQ